MTRYFVNYIDDEEVRELRKTQHERPIGEYEDGEKIMSHLGTVVQQYVGLASTPDQDVIDNPPEVIGISKTEQPGHGTIWWMTRPLILSWIKPRKELDFESTWMHQRVCWEARKKGQAGCPFSHNHLVTQLPA